MDKVAQFNVQQVERIAASPYCLRADPTIPYGQMVRTTFQQAEFITELQQPVWIYRSGNKVIFCYRKGIEPFLEVAMSAEKQPKPDPRRLLALYNHPSTCITVDLPKGRVAVSFDEAELLICWGRPVVVWGTLKSPTFWALPSDMPALVSLRVVRREEP